MDRLLKWMDYASYAASGLLVLLAGRNYLIAKFAHNQVAANEGAAFFCIGLLMLTVCLQSTRINWLRERIAGLEQDAEDLYEGDA